MKNIEVIEIWKPVDGRQNLKLIATIANGHPIKIERDYVLKKSVMTQDEFDNKYLK